METLQDKMNQMENYWEHFKEVNDERIKELETKSTVDCLTEEKLKNLTNLMEEQKDQIKTLQKNAARNTIEIKAVENSEENYGYQNAFNNYLRKGIESDLNKFETKASDLINSMDTTNSGMFLAPNIQKFIMDLLAERCIMRKICSVQEISTNSLDIIKNSSFDTAWGGELTEVSDTNSGNLAKTTIQTFELIAQPKVTQKLVDDVAIDFEQWLAYQLSNDFLIAEETAFISGDGSNKPTGILNYDSTTIERITSSSTENYFDETDVLNLYYSLNEKYTPNASFIMSRNAVQQIRKFKDATSGNYLWNPALLGGQEDTLLGCPVYQTGNINNVGTTKDIIVFGDFKQYQIVDRMGIRILRDPFTAKPYIRFYTTKRVGGDVIDKNAFKILKTSSYTA